MDQIMAVLLRSGVALAAGLVLLGGVIFLRVTTCRPQIIASFTANRRNCEPLRNLS